MNAERLVPEILLWEKSAYRQNAELQGWVNCPRAKAFCSREGEKEKPASSHAVEAIMDIEMVWSFRQEKMNSENKCAVFVAKTLKCFKKYTVVDCEKCLKMSCLKDEEREMTYLATERLLVASGLVFKWN